MRPSISWIVLGSVLGLACGCPKGNVVVPARNVSFDLQLWTADQMLTGHGSSPPAGDGISFDRATIVTPDPQTPPPLPDDLVLYSMAPGCHPDDSGTAVCDWDIRSQLTVHGVMAGPALINLDDQRAELLLSAVMTPPPATGPCPGKPGIYGCPADGGGATVAYVPYTNLTGQLALTALAENCTQALSSCALTAQGTLALTATGPGAEAVSLGAGTLTAADTFIYRSSCSD